MRALPIFLLIFFAACHPSLTSFRGFSADGRSLRLQQVIPDNNIYVLVFLAADCPISQKYVRTLDSLQQRFPQVPIVGVFTRWEKPEDIRRYQEAFQPDFVLFQDQNNKLALRLGATITPEALLIHNETVWYQGAIDNWYYALGRYRTAPTECYLGDAIEAALQNRPAPRRSTKALGCGIEF